MGLVNFLTTGLFLPQTNWMTLNKTFTTLNIHGKQKQEELYFLITIFHVKILFIYYRERECVPMHTSKGEG